jgi:hypothetical protein
METVSIFAVGFNRLTNVGGLPTKSVYSSQDDIAFIQGRTFGVRIVFRDERHSILIPWHNVDYVVETKPERD